MFCPNCGKEIKTPMNFCPECGYSLTEENNSTLEEPISPSNEEKQTNFDNDSFYGCGEDDLIEEKSSSEGKHKSSLIAGILAIFFGYLGFHNFYLGRYRNAIIQLLLSIVSALGLVLLAPATSTANPTFGMIQIVLSMIGIIYVTLWIFIDLIRIATNKIDSVFPLRSHRYEKYILIALFVIVIGFSIKGIANEIKKADPLVIEVRESYMLGISYDDLINSIMGNPIWTKVDDSTINVTGKVKYRNGETATLGIGFKIDSEGDVTIYAMELDGVPQNATEISYLLSDMYKTATTKGLEK